MQGIFKTNYLAVDEFKMIFIISLGRDRVKIFAVNIMSLRSLKYLIKSLKMKVSNLNYMSNYEYFELNIFRFENHG